MYSTRSRPNPLLGLLAMLAVFGLVAAACSDDDDSAGPEVGTDVEDVTDVGDDGVVDDGIVEDLPFAEDELVGEEVTVSGDIFSIEDAFTFQIEGPDGPLLVFSADALPEGTDEGTLVQVTGTVREVLVDTFENDFGFAYDPLYETFVERAAIAADEVVVLEGDDGAQAGPPLAANAELSELNDSDVEGDAAIVVEDLSMTVTLSAQNTSGSLPHAMHIHFEPGTPSTCPDDEFDEDDDGFLTTAEGVPAYGPVQVALTTDGDFSADSALELGRFPSSDADGRLTFDRTFDIDQATFDAMAETMQVAVVIHGADLDDSAEYDGDAESSLDPDLPLEATLPVACGIAELA